MKGFLFLFDNSSRGETIEEKLSATLSFSSNQINSDLSCSKKHSNSFTTLYKSLKVEATEKDTQSIYGSENTLKLSILLIDVHFMNG